MEFGKTRGTGGGANDRDSQYIEMYGSEAGKAVKYFSTMSTELEGHLEQCSERDGGSLIFPDALQSFYPETGRPTLNSHTGDKIQLNWLKG